MNGNEIGLIISKAMLYIIYAEVIIGGLIIVFVIILMLCMHRNDVTSVISTDLPRIELGDYLIVPPIEVPVEGAIQLLPSSSKKDSNVGSDAVVSNEKELQERIHKILTSDAFKRDVLDDLDETVEPVGSTESHSKADNHLKESGTLRKRNVPKENKIISEIN